MSGVYLKGLKMPRGKDEAIMIAIYDGKAHVVVGTQKKVEALELPDHGDLVDKKELMRGFADFVRASNNSDFAEVPTWNDAVSLVESTSVVIPAERSE